MYSPKTLLEQRCMMFGAIVKALQGQLNQNNVISVLDGIWKWTGATLTDAAIVESFAETELTYPHDGLDTYAVKGIRWWHMKKRLLLSTILLIGGLIYTTFNGIHVKSNEGQYKGYVTAVEKNGVIFKGWNVYLKTELESSQEDVACINRNDAELIARLKEAQENKENVTLLYEGVLAYGIGECPQSTWMVIGIK